MKKVQKIMMVTAILFIGVAMTACSSKSEESTAATEQEQTTPATDSTASASAKGFVCPMGCEEGKKYDKEGKCPDCGMDLVPAKS